MPEPVALTARYILNSTEAGNEEIVRIAKGRLLTGVAAKVSVTLPNDDYYLRVSYTYLLNTPTSRGDFYTKHLQPGASFNIDRNATLEIQILVQVFPYETFTIIKR